MLDDAEAGTLGFFPLLPLALLILGGIAGGYVVYQVGGTAVTETQEAIKAVRKVAVGGLAVWLALAILRDNKRRRAA